jgi:DNA-binding IclR family transcriptional regulator
MTKALSPGLQAEANVLAVLREQDGDFGVLNFAEIIICTGLTRPVVRRACRSLARKGFASFHRGCWTEDGRPAGSGYAAAREPKR